MTKFHQWFAVYPLFASSVMWSSAAAQEQSVFSMEFNGGRGWMVACTLQRFNEDPLEFERHGRGRIVTFAARGVSSGTCDYEIPQGRENLKITFVNDAAPNACPFEWEFERCVGYFEPGAIGTFSF